MASADHIAMIREAQAHAITLRICSQTSASLNDSAVHVPLDSAAQIADLLDLLSSERCDFDCDGCHD